MNLALLELAANGTALDAGQTSLVRQMCSSGARLQLAIAPAGAGKTTAMRALTLAWSQDGGQVLGLAPSTAAAAVLAEQTGIRTDTLAKLTWSLRHGDLPDWAATVGPSTLLIIDEAGTADTLTLDAAVQVAIERGASVRLIGDDQQLAAIGAGGILRDIKHTHGALHLTELHRFTNPAEATASLAIREGKPEALKFYLDHDRVHVGDRATTTEDAFTAWVLDRSAGLDAIMLASTRELFAKLNRRARDHRLDQSPASSKVCLADGNQASVGDVIITRSNDRRLRLSATDWVKNNDRWSITGIGRRGDLTVRHNRSHLTVRLPSDYVHTSTGLGLADAAAHLLALAAEAGKHPLRHLLTAAAGRELDTTGDMAAVLYWRLPELAPVDPGPLPWLPDIPETLRSHPGWGPCLAKRFQLVADLADQVHDHACQRDLPPAWALAGCHPTALIGEIAVWRAANGINPQDPRPTGGTQLETLPALWKQRLDRDMAHATYPPAGARTDQR